jgi:hypothetical protein
VDLALNPEQQAARELAAGFAGQIQQLLIGRALTGVSAF